MVPANLLYLLNPQALKPLKEVVLSFDRSYISLCENCRNRDCFCFPFPCKFRKTFAWKKCRHHEPISRNSFLAQKIIYLTKWLTLDEAIGLYHRGLGAICKPIKAKKQRETT